MDAAFLAQLPQVEAMCEMLYTAQVRGWSGARWGVGGDVRVPSALLLGVCVAVCWQAVVLRQGAAGTPPPAWLLRQPLGMLVVARPAARGVPHTSVHTHACTHSSSGDGRQCLWLVSARATDTACLDACVPSASARARARVCTQTPQERTQAEQALRPFSQSTEYIAHCKVRAAAVQAIVSTLSMLLFTCAAHTAALCRACLLPARSFAPSCPMPCALCAVCCVPCAVCCVSHCHHPTHQPPPPHQTILDNSRSPYAQLLASSSLLKLITEHQLT
jgi:hypothetical protein